MSNTRKHTRTRTRTTSRRGPAGGHRPATTRARPRTRARTKTRTHLTRTLVDHDTIRKWAEDRSGKPTRVKGTSRGRRDVGMIRIDFPGYTGEGKLEPISWDDWFEKFDESNLALIVQYRTAGGEISHFNKLIAREGSPRRAQKRRGRGASATARPASR